MPTKRWLVFMAVFFLGLALYYMFKALGIVSEPILDAGVIVYAVGMLCIWYLVLSRNRK